MLSPTSTLLYSLAEFATVCVNETPLLQLEILLGICRVLFTGIGSVSRTEMSGHSHGTK